MGAEVKAKKNLFTLLQKKDLILAENYNVPLETTS